MVGLAGGLLSALVGLFRVGGRFPPLDVDAVADAVNEARRRRLVSLDPFVAWAVQQIHDGHDLDLVAQEIMIGAQTYNVSDADLAVVFGHALRAAYQTGSPFFRTVPGQVITLTPSKPPAPDEPSDGREK